MLEAPLSPGAPPRPGAGPQPRGATGLERFRLAHRALPGRDLADVELSTSLLGVTLAAPVVVAASGDVARSPGPPASTGSGSYCAAAAACPRTRSPTAGRRSGRRCCSPASASAHCAVRTARAAPSASPRCWTPTGWPRSSIPTADAIAEAVLVAPGLRVLAAAGDGVEAATWLALGATAAAIPWPVDAAALVHQLRVAVWATGAASADALTPGHLRA